MDSASYISDTITCSRKWTDLLVYAKIDIVLAIEKAEELHVFFKEKRDIIKVLFRRA